MCVGAAPRVWKPAAYLALLFPKKKKKKKKSSADEYPYVRALKCAVAPSRLPVTATSCELFHLSSHVLSILMCPSSPFHPLCFLVGLVVSPDASPGPNFQLHLTIHVFSHAFVCAGRVHVCQLRSDRWIWRGEMMVQIMKGGVGDEPYVSGRFQEKSRSVRGTGDWKRTPRATR